MIAAATNESSSLKPSKVRTATCITLAFVRRTASASHRDPDRAGLILRDMDTPAPAEARPLRGDIAAAGPTAGEQPLANGRVEAAGHRVFDQPAMRAGEERAQFERHLATGACGPTMPMSICSGWYRAGSTASTASADPSMTAIQPGPLSAQCGIDNRRAVDPQQLCDLSDLGFGRRAAAQQRWGGKKQAGRHRVGSSPARRRIPARSRRPASIVRPLPPTHAHCRSGRMPGEGQFVRHGEDAQLAIACISSVVRPSASAMTASGLPVSGSVPNTSTRRKGRSRASPVDDGWSYRATTGADRYTSVRSCRTVLVRLAVRWRAPLTKPAPAWWSRDPRPNRRPHADAGRPAAVDPRDGRDERRRARSTVVEAMIASRPRA
ncbi:unnamed protein product [Acanthosepion pharaonis]|uniref:Uncharacterized protein n=1 Tax=Acanthosepion pharaonis TaxID=158019 RepID=A0A812DII3_ACAPH|nr:unnamed protein product [Sepia pharaonis]